MKSKILIVEDEPAMVAGLRDNFEYEGYDVISAEDGVSGLERALNDSPARHGGGSLTTSRETGPLPRVRGALSTDRGSRRIRRPR